MEYIRAFANMKADFVDSKFTEKQIQHFEFKLKEYLHIRETIRKASGETIDLKAYEADMRFLIDTYIGAEEAKKFTPFDDVSLLDMLEADPDKDLEDVIPTYIPDKNPDAAAEIIENNVRSKIVEKQLLDPIYFDEMSVLLNDLIKKRKQEQIKYKEYLQKMAELIKQVNKGTADDTPETMNTQGKRAIYNILDKDEDLAKFCEEAIQYNKQDGFRENLAKQRMLKQAIYDIVKDEKKVEEIYKVIEANKSDY